MAECLNRIFIFVSYAIALLFAGCGYHCSPSFDHPITLSIPYVERDLSGECTDQLVRAAAASGKFRYVQADGEVILKVKLEELHKEPIGWRYQREEDGTIEDELIAVEDRAGITAEVLLIDGLTGRVLYGPKALTVTMEYDYSAPDLLSDLSVINSAGQRVSAIQFSLGQLDSSDAAADQAFSALASQLAKKIIDHIARARY
jgi:hypothetical protein